MKFDLDIKYLIIPEQKEVIQLVKSNLKAKPNETSKKFFIAIQNLLYDSGIEEKEILGNE